ncbi:hypothetical protein [Vulgatibacter sp.]|uniref:hypothetical protein n=1 Tax=Vulgatibacter sp. TaxID=1971226 RepID=UPI003565A335
MRWFTLLGAVGWVALVPAQAEADCAPSCAAQLCMQQWAEAWGAARGTVLEGEALTVRLDQVHGPLASEISVGTELPLEIYVIDAPGPDTEVLVAVEQWGAERSARAIATVDQAGQVRCDGEAIDLDEALAIAVAPDCEDRALESGYDSGAECDDTEHIVGCSAGGGAPWWGVVGALITLVLPRWRR